MGTKQYQIQNFLTPLFKAIKGAKVDRVLSLPGNHDYMKSGKGFFYQLEQLGQQGPYFRANFGAEFTILGLDTSIDSIRFRDPHAMSMAVEDHQFLWMKYHLEDCMATGRKVIVMSHHPVLSCRHGVNEALLSQVKPYLSIVLAWYSGHDHEFVAFEPYQGLQKARCIGNGGKASSRKYSDTSVEIMDCNLLRRPQEELGTKIGSLCLKIEKSGVRARHYELTQEAVSVLVYEEKLF